jgi:hypothetical protein
VTAARSSLVGLALVLLFGVSASAGHAEPAQVNTIRELLARLETCWRPPPASQANPIDITVIVSFDRTGAILGRPKITFESETANDNDRLLYRIAVMEALQRCAPMPFTEAMGGAVAGRPFAVHFHHKPSTPEKRAWLTPKIL